MFVALLMAALFFGVSSAAALAWLYKRRLGRWPPLLRAANCALSVTSIGTDAICKKGYGCSYKPTDRHKALTLPNQYLTEQCSLYLSIYLSIYLTLLIR
jgi:hypothetical protein